MFEFERELGSIPWIYKPQAHGLLLQVGKAVAWSDLHLPPCGSVEQLDLFIIRGGGDEVFMHVDAGAERVVVPVPICVKCHVWETHSIDEGRSGAEVIGQELKYDGGLELRREIHEGMKGEIWRIYVVLQACHHYSLLSQLLYMIYCRWKLESQAHPVVSYIPQADGPASLSSQVRIVIKPVNAGDFFC